MLANGFGDLGFHRCIIKVPMWWEWWKAQVRPEFVSQPVKVELAGHFKADDFGNPVEVLAPFDLNTVACANRDVEVLANAAKTAAYTACLAEYASQGHGGALGVVGRKDVGRGCDFNQGQTESVEIVQNLLAVSRAHGVEFSSAVLLQADDVHADRPFVGLQHTIGSDEGGALESAGV